MSKIDRVIQYFRNLKEEAPTMSSDGGNLPTNNISGPGIDRFDPVIGFRKRRGGKIDGRSVAKKYKNWMKSLGLLER
jgi:hypothetical protein